ncbi:hypothetical protein SDC9_198620 [bioreactor metagenome]|uniref:YoaP-like domain-containing protein n=2 Tax=root TaxID=1 RepID=A0A645IKI5_9ZZZZ
MQCPFIYQNIESLKEYCDQNHIMAFFKQVHSLDEAKDLPCVFNNYGIFYKGSFQTVNLINPESLTKILNK